MESEIDRRQLILPAFGPAAQGRLCKAGVLVIGAGGLGCPAALYLAAAGVGRLGIVDQDAVELSNLHRQVAHRESSVGMHKADSAAQACRALNSSIQVDVHREGFTPANALELASAYDVIVDATDNAASRYLISDACVIARRPLVSGAALGTDGQLTVYNHGPDGPCYRCMFPEAPRPESCSRCSDAGVLGVVPGIIGTLQALEAIKLASGVGKPLSRTLLLADCMSGRFTSIKLRAKMPGCIACGHNPSITAQSLPEYDYNGFTGAPSNDTAPQSLQLLPARERITAGQLHQLLDRGTAIHLVDVRPREQFEIAHMPGSHNYPFDESRKDAFRQHIGAIMQLAEKEPGVAVGNGNNTEDADGDRRQQENSSRGERLGRPVCIVCRRGNDSQHVVHMLKQNGFISAVDLSAGTLEKDLQIVVLFALASTGKRQAHGISVKRRVGVGLAWAALSFPVGPNIIDRGKMLDIDGEVKTLVEKIKELGSPDKADHGRIKVKYGLLFRETSDLFEALAGTMRAAKRKKLVTFDGELLLQGVHDNVDVVLLEAC
ncbi:g5009 [Coccomyxa elongata]